MNIQHPTQIPPRFGGPGCPGGTDENVAKALSTIGQAPLLLDEDEASSGSRPSSHPPNQGAIKPTYPSEPEQSLEPNQPTKKHAPKTLPGMIARGLRALASKLEKL